MSLFQIDINLKMEDIENILGFDFALDGNYVLTGISDPEWFDSGSFDKLKGFLEKHKKTDIIKLQKDCILIHKSYLLEFIRFHNFEKYTIMIENATDNFFDSGKIIPPKTVKEDKTVFEVFKDLLS